MPMPMSTANRRRPDKITSFALPLAYQPRRWVEREGIGIVITELGIVGGSGGSGSGSGSGVYLLLNLWFGRRGWT